MYKFCNKKPGQILLEVLVSITLSGMFIIATAFAFSSLLFLNYNNRNLETAINLGNSLMDNAAALADADWHNISSLIANHYYVNVFSGSYAIALGEETVSIGGVTFTRYFYVEDVMRDSNGLIVANNPLDAVDPSTRKITVVVTWPRATTGVSLSKYVTRYKNSVFWQTDWSGGSGQENFATTNDTTLVNNQFANSSGISTSTQGELSLNIGAGSLSGELTSSVFDTLVTRGAAINSIMWHGTKPVGTTVKFQVASQNSGPGSWTTQTPAGGFTGYFYNISYGNNLWIAVGYNGQIQTSPDGINWTKRTPAGGYIGTFLDVYYGNNLWIAVGTGGEIQTSSNNGITWTKRTPAQGYTGSFQGISYGNNLWIAVGYNGQIQTSPDGINWTKRTPAGSYTGTFYGIANNGSNLWIAVGASMAGGNSEIQTSPDGITWTKRTPAGTFTGAGEVAYCANLWVTVGESGGIETSPDGITWTKRTPAGGYAGWFHDITCGSLWMITGTGGEIQTSSNGITWTKHTPPVGVSYLYGVAYGSSLWAIVGSDGDIITSPDGAESATWNYLGSDGTSATYYGPVNPDTPVKISRADHNNKRYMRYKIFLDAPAGGATPTVTDIIMNWSR